MIEVMRNSRQATVLSQSARLWAKRDVVEFTFVTALEETFLNNALAIRITSSLNRRALNKLTLLNYTA
jgi:hypothetical protein